MVRTATRARGRHAKSSRDQRSGASLLGIARVCYLALVGLGFLWAAERGVPAEIGYYSLAVSVGAIATVILQYGIDRMLLVELSDTAEMTVSSWKVWLRRRSISLVVALSALVVSLFFLPIGVPVTILVLSRILLSDFENIAIPSGKMRLVACATLVNGIVSGCAIAAAGTSGAVMLAWASTLGNLVGLIVISPALLLSTRAISTRFKKDGDLAAPIKLSWHASLPFAGMAISATVYQRADLGVMGLLGVTAAQLAAYAIALRAFEAVVAFRGALVQHHASNSLSRNRDAAQFLQWSKRLCLAATGAGLSIIVAAILFRNLGILSDYGNIWTLVAIIGVGTPLIASHTLTSTWIYSNRGSYATMSVSIGLATLSVLMTCGAMVLGGVALVTVAATVKEYVSFLVFWKPMKREKYPTLGMQIAMMWPISSALLALIFLGWAAT